ncbi:pentapeptide repeat-containing protein [Phormidium sp. FACHB-1136]|uniref:pentapeptide repeat-containing protein n=1 Tax=Phormidium sp. FACHB-1136 TaxID=2692848 RepID=UPI0016872240|nr:pentapeptide repeat-containing protein [Phormidium sp. FACHB-1136]MBD2428644.1 pentapeptide repeat-containing protein [Phormidium sp. FACHB-1136]
MTSVPPNPAPSGGTSPDRPAAPIPLPTESVPTTPTNASPASPASAPSPGEEPMATSDPPLTPVSPLASANAVTLVAVAIIFMGLIVDSVWLILAGSLVATVVSLRLMWPVFAEILAELSPRQQSLVISIPSVLIGLFGLMRITGINRAILTWGLTLRWDVLGALGDFLGAIGQIFIAFLALFVAWRQYVISRDLTLQQNLITQQQTIDAYFQGISDLVLDEEGLLEDWPQERIIAEARTAAILSSVDAGGKAKVIRFLSRSRLLTPLKRDNRLGRAILDGRGGYEEDRAQGTRVIDLGAMLAMADLHGTDLRWADLSEANLIRANLQRCDLVKTNFSRAILCDADLSGADLMGTLFFYGDAKTATPRTRTSLPDYATGANTGAVVEGINLTNVERLSEEQRWYCCAWGGSFTRATVPGGCGDIPNLLGR